MTGGKADTSIDKYLDLTSNASTVVLNIKTMTYNDAKVADWINKEFTVGIKVNWSTKFVASEWYSVRVKVTDPWCEDMANWKFATGQGKRADFSK